MKAGACATEVHRPRWEGSSEAASARPRACPGRGTSAARSLHDVRDGIARLRRPPGQVRLNALPKRRDSAECGTGYARRVSRCRAEVRLRLGWDKHAAGHALDELDAGSPAPPTAAFTADPGIDGLGRWGRAHLLELGRGVG